MHLCVLQLAAMGWFRSALEAVVPPDADEEEVQELLDRLRYTAFFFKVRSPAWGSSFCRRLRDTSVMQSAHHQSAQRISIPFRTTFDSLSVIRYHTAHKPHGRADVFVQVLLDASGSHGMS